MSQGRQNPVLDGLTARLELLDDSDLKHHAMATGFKNPASLVRRKHRDATHHSEIVLSNRLSNQAWECIVPGKWVSVGLVCN
jgi:hypothetical protein